MAFQQDIKEAVRFGRLRGGWRMVCGQETWVRAAASCLRAVSTQERERIGAVGCHAKSGIAASM